MHYIWEFRVQSAGERLQKRVRVIGRAECMGQHINERGGWEVRGFCDTRVEE
jgi:hypothetical protein